MKQVSSQSMIVCTYYIVREIPLTCAPVVFSSQDANATQIKEYHIAIHHFFLPDFAYAEHLCMFSWTNRNRIRVRIAMPGAIVQALRWGTTADYNVL